MVGVHQGRRLMPVGSCIAGRPGLLQLQGHGEGALSVTEFLRELSPGCPNRDIIREVQVTSRVDSELLRYTEGSQWPMLGGASHRWWEELGLFID